MNSHRVFIALSAMLLALLACQPLSIFPTPTEPAGGTGDVDATSVAAMVSTLAAQTLEARDTTTQAATAVPTTTEADETTTDAPVQAATETTNADAPAASASLVNPDPDWQAYTAQGASGVLWRNGDIGMVNITNGDHRVLTSYGYNTAPKLSPDGRYIAYQSIPSALTSDPNWQQGWDDQRYNVWAISADGTQTFQLTDSVADRTNLRWSPVDTAMLAWLEGGDTLMLKGINARVDRAYPVAGAVHFEWHPDGNLFTVVKNGRLVNIDVASGAETALIDQTALPDGVNAIDVTWFSNGTHIAYTLVDSSACTDENMPPQLCETKEIHIVDVASGTVLHTIEGARAAKISPDGSQMTVLEGSGYGDACGVDLGLGLLTLGPDYKPTVARTLPDIFLPEVLSLQDTSGPYPTDYDQVVWRDNETVVAALGLPCSPTVTAAGQYVIDVNAGTATQLSANGIPFDPAQSTLDTQLIAAGADPTQLIVGITKPTIDTPYLGDITVMQANGANAKQLTTYGYNRNPVLSPDGTQIAYQSVASDFVNSGGLATMQSPDDAPYNIWIINVDGSNPIQVTNSADVFRGKPSWSPGGDYIAFSEGGTIVEYNIATGEQIVWGDAFAVYPKYAPDNETLWYVDGNGALIRRSRLTGETTVFASTDTRAGTVGNFVFGETPYQPEAFNVLFSIEDSSVVPEIGSVVPSELYVTAGNAVETYEGTSVFGGSNIRPEVYMQDRIVGRTGSGYGDACVVDLNLNISGGFGDSSSTTINTLTILPLTDPGTFFYLPDHQPMQPLSDRIIMVYLQDTCTPEGASQGGWYAVDIIKKSAVLVSLGG